MAGGYLRTNYRAINTQLGPLALGGGFLRGSLGMINASGASTGVGNLAPYGGFIHGYFSDDFAAGYIEHSALGAMQSYFQVAGITSGYKIVPFAIMVHYFSGSDGALAGGSGNFCGMYATFSTSDTSMFRFYALGAASAAGKLKASFSCRMRWFGFIVSTPDVS